MKHFRFEWLWTECSGSFYYLEGNENLFSFYCLAIETMTDKWNTQRVGKLKKEEQ